MMDRTTDGLEGVLHTWMTQGSALQTGKHTSAIWRLFSVLTAYHPESNGAVERLHRYLKDAIRARAAMATWSEELPFVIL